MVKLDYMVEDKIHMRSIGPYSLITQQPLGRKSQGEARGLEKWRSLGFGRYTRRPHLARNAYHQVGRHHRPNFNYNSIIRSERFKSPHLPASFHVLVSELRGLALDIDIKKNQEGTIILWIQKCSILNQ